MIFCMEMRRVRVSGRHRWFWARPSKRVPLQFSGFYPATLPDEWIKDEEKERDNNDLVDEIKPGEEEE